jgi:hypothetical protein
MREEGHVQQVVGEIGDGNPPVVNIHQIADGLEGVKRDTYGQYQMFDLKALS